MQSRPMRAARRAASAKASRMRASPAASSARGAGSLGSRQGRRATVGQPPAAAEQPSAVPRSGARRLAPGVGSWTASGIDEYLRTLSSTRRGPLRWPPTIARGRLAKYAPEAPPAVASRISRPAAGQGQLARWIVCQSVARPSASAEYWVHRGNHDGWAGRGRRGIGREEGADMGEGLLDGNSGSIRRPHACRQRWPE